MGTVSLIHQQRESSFRGIAPSTRRPWDCRNQLSMTLIVMIQIQTRILMRRSEFPTCRLLSHCRCPFHQQCNSLYLPLRRLPLISLIRGFLLHNNRMRMKRMKYLFKTSLSGGANETGSLLNVSSNPAMLPHHPTLLSRSPINRQSTQTRQNSGSAQWRKNTAPSSRTTCEHWSLCLQGASQSPPDGSSSSRRVLMVLSSATRPDGSPKASASMQGSTMTKPSLLLPST